MRKEYLTAPIYRHLTNDKAESPLAQHCLKYLWKHEVYREIHHNFLDTENELTEELLKYVPSELVDKIKKHYNNRLNFTESYALEKATDRLARRFDCVITFADYLNKEDE